MLPCSQTVTDFVISFSWVVLYSSCVFAFVKLVLSKSILQKKTLRIKDKLCFQKSFYILQRQSGIEGERYGSREGQN